MAQSYDKYHSVKDSFWTDPLILDLLPEEKLFYLWLITNRMAHICGCYQVSLRTMEYELNLSRDAVLQLINNFIDLGRIRYSEENKEIILLKWHKHNSGFFEAGNKNTRKSILAGVEMVKTPEFREIVLDWLGNQKAPIVEGDANIQAPSKPLASPLQGATLAPCDKLKIKEKIKEKETQQQHACASDQLAEVAKEHQEDLKRLFPDCNMPVAIEKMLAFFQGRPELLLDPYLTMLKWFQREIVVSTGPDARASPGSGDRKSAERERIIEKNKEAARVSLERAIARGET